MKRFAYFCRAGLRRLLHIDIPLRTPSAGLLLACLSALGFAGICYLLGAAVMFFQLPTSDFLDKAFTGAKAWQERGRSQIPLRTSTEVGPGQGITVDKPDQTWDGFTLYTTTQGSRATLINMAGEVVHRWELPFRQAWPHAPHVPDPLPDDQIHWFRCYLYPNGDLLAIYHADGDTPFGYGLVKLNKDSKLLWAYAGRVHHDADVGEDGTIYTLTQKIMREAPAGVDFVPTPYLADSLVVLSAQGQELDSLPILEALRDSPYVLTLASVTKFSSLVHVLSGQDSSSRSTVKGDFLHANSVKVLSRMLAPKFPLFQAGQVLISLRNLDTLAVLDTQKRSAAWAAGGIWRIQHDAEFLKNGHLLLYDNYGGFKGTRILEYDPLTQAIPWSYANENATPFTAFLRGVKQRLPNGNTLIVDPDSARIFEVTANKELVWEIYCLAKPASQDPHSLAHAVNGARRYSLEELTFLRGVARPRP